MTARAMRAVPAFVPEALVASQVGTWERDPDAEIVRCDPIMAAMYGVSEEEADAGVTLKRLGESIHPADRALFRSKVELARRRGGLIVVEYRVVPRPGVERWVLARGYYEAAQGWQNMAGGRGIVIDITASKLDGHVEDRAFFTKVDHAPDEAPLDRAASLAVEARHVIDAMGEQNQPGLRQAVDALLWAVGRALARRSAADA